MDSSDSLLSPSLIESLLPPLRLTYGAYLLGTFVGTLLYGFALHQSYRYARLFPTDSLFLRVLVIGVMAMETVHTAFTMHTCYYFLVENYANPFAMLQGVWSVNCISIIAGLIMLLSQVFFVRRVFLMGDHYRMISVVAIAFFVAEIGVAAALVHTIFTVSSFAQTDQVNHLLAAMFAAAAAGDALLTTSLLRMLYKSRNQAFSSASEPLGTMVITYVVNTGMLHNVMNIATLCLALAQPDTLLAPTLSIVITKVYANTLLAVLNSRKLLVSREIKVFEGGEHFGMNILARAETMATKERWNVPQVPDTAPAMMRINVTTEMEGPGVSSVSSDVASDGGTLRKCEGTL
ncbi:hypothetical protein C8Q76DRAFT_739878 [Earliella scabrosa]|nr:hypothetical protein C8Q76DRAFT_739878 [Earliella scabrosa]